MTWIVVVALGLGWIAGLGGITAAVTSGLLERVGRTAGRRPSVLRGRARWALLWLVLTPASGLTAVDAGSYRREARAPSRGRRDALAAAGSYRR